jgi:hypothetical protein
MASRPNRPLAPARLLAIVVLFVSGTLVSACGNDEEQEVYCVDAKTHQVVSDEDMCEGADGGGVYHYWLSSPGHAHGYTVPVDSRSSYINPKDATARSKAGLPTTGKVSGTKITSGGIGKGGGSNGGSSGS